MVSNQFSRCGFYTMHNEECMMRFFEFRIHNGVASDHG